MRLHRLLACTSSVFALVLSAAYTPLAHADTIDWTTWTAGTSGSPGSASGTIGSLTVSYSGQTNGLNTGYPSWDPTSSYIGGVVGNAPPAADNAVAMDGGVSYTETITFSSVVADPIIAIWSLGAGGDQASFVFPSSEPISLVAGGPSNEYGGSSLTISGNTVYGEEGNGVVVVNGDYSSITFTTPQFEDYYAFTVGEDQTLTSQLPNGPVVPEPATFSLLGLGLAALPFARARFSRSRA
ncbi:MAG: PEP-CTERM sorting domain-containing protein [Acidobacteriaceae bacterium]|jgi:hypothetical protein